MAQGVKAPAELRFWEHVDQSGMYCWPWKASRLGSKYGGFWDSTQMVLAHRFSYELYYGPLDEDTVDHLCRNTLCVNPLHLEAVTLAENIKRAGEAVTHCKHGHEYTLENTYIHPKRGRRDCRACRNNRSRARR